MKIYGIKNCTTVKNALAWLDAHQVAYEFHDFKKLGIDGHQLQTWIDKMSMDKIMNQRSATWKTIPTDIQQAALNDHAAAIKLMQDKTSIIKRPLLEVGNDIVLGFDEKKYAEIFV